jgi:hypothetical protein
VAIAYSISLSEPSQRTLIGFVAFRSRQHSRNQNATFLSSAVTSVTIHFCLGFGARPTWA